MTAIISFFPVGNGDMTLIALPDGNQSQQATRILIDCNIRNAADDPNDPARDVAKDLRTRIGRDLRGRPYIDVFAWSHPDHDHCNGLLNHFYLGPPGDYPDDHKPDHQKRILIREIWSSPMVFRRASKNHTLCADAKAMNTEVKRRVAFNRAYALSSVSDGNRILILGEDESGKTDDLKHILVPVDMVFNRVNGKQSQYFSAHLLAPMPISDDVTEDVLSKNHSSVIMNMRIVGDVAGTTSIRFLSGGDAEVAIWDRLYDKHKNNLEVLRYDLMQTPHHNSWHTLSYESWSKTQGTAQPSVKAVTALSQSNPGAVIVSSSDPIYNDYNDPPCYGAKLIYDQIARDARGIFYCTGEYLRVGQEVPLEFSVTATGLRRIEPTVATQSLLRPAAAIGGLQFPDKAIAINKSAGFA